MCIGNQGHIITIRGSTTHGCINTVLSLSSSYNQVPNMTLIQLLFQYRGMKGIRCTLTHDWFPLLRCDHRRNLPPASSNFESMPFRSIMLHIDNRRTRCACLREQCVDVCKNLVALVCTVDQSCLYIDDYKCSIVDHN